MSQIRLPGDPPIEIHLRRSARSRRLSLRLSRLDGRVTMTLPERVPEAQAIAFARQKEAWLRHHLGDQAQAVRVGPGTLLPVLGRSLRVVPGTGAAVIVEADTIAVPGPEDRIAPRLRGWLRQLARDRLAEASDRYARALGRPFGRLTLRDTRSRWGSCTSDGNLMYSWRLVMAPDDVLNYVAAHEVAHLAEMNHSPAFWATVTRIHGPWQAQRDWLREFGPGLHRYRFDD